MKVLEVVTDHNAIARLLYGARTAASLSSWTVGVVRLSPRPNVAVGFARPAVDVASRSPARAVS